MENSRALCMAIDGEWKSYLNDRVICDRGGYVVIKPTEMEPQMPLCCSVCDFMFRTIADEISYREYLCCERCEMLWARPKASEWKEGWRPTRDQINEANLKRSPLTFLIGG